jgi:prolyl 4-hydroxylase
MMSDTDLAPFDPLADPRKLAWFGHVVRERLRHHPQVDWLATQGAEVFRVDGFLKRRDCRDLVSAINRLAAPSPLYGGTGEPDFRTSYTHHFANDDPLPFSCEQYIADLLGIDLAYSERMQGQRYTAGQQFKHHEDYLSTEAEYWPVEGPRGGQRTWTAMVCLNQPTAGGETDFPELGLRVRLNTGSLLAWNNMTPEGRPNPRTRHAGLPVERGVKHVITKWFRQEPCREMF